MKRWKQILALCLLAAMLTGVCLLADGLEMRYGLRRDHSFNQVTTQSETTLEVLSELTHPVHIYAAYARGSEDGPLMELLARYASASALVTYEQVDLSLNPGLLTRFRTATSSDNVITNDSLIVTCEETGRFRVLDATDFYTLGYNLEEGAYEIAGLSYEGALTGAIRYVSLDEVPRIVMLQGHGELDADGTGVLADLLSSNNFEVVYASLAGGETELDPENDVLFILSPVRDLMETELEQIRTFAGEGGSLFFTCDYTDPVENMPGFASLMRAYGFVPRDGIVIASEAEPSSYYGDYQIYLLPIMQGTEITADLVASGSSTLLLAGSRAFETPEKTDREMTVWTVLTSGSRAYLRSLEGDLSTLDQQPEDAMGPFPLSLQSERITQSGDVSRAFILGCSTLLTSSEVYAMTDAQEFIVRACEYLSGRENTDLAILARQAVRPALKATSLTLGALLIVLLPLGVLLVSMAILIPRYRKH
ncbi:MAG: Gldg family protein [Clostridia bacterium]|nr:Gldg family protein [Clostridia bacterium]